MLKKTFIVVLFFWLINCNQKTTNNIPEEILGTDNLILINIDEAKTRSISLIREREFGNTNDVIIGSLGRFSVDESNRVFIGDTQQQTIHVFDGNGQYLMSLGEEGRGPGEFQFVGNMTIVEDLLFVYDQLQFKYNIFSIIDAEYKHSVFATESNNNEFEELAQYTLMQLIPINKQKFIGVFSYPVVYSDPSRREYNLDKLDDHFVILDSTGKILTNKIYSASGTKILTATVNGEFRSTMFVMMGKTLVKVSQNHQIYLARSEDLFIQVFNEEGEAVKAFYYPYPKVKFSRSDAIFLQEKQYGENEEVFRWRESVIRNASETDIPEAWPALNDLIIDDKNRLWVSTIVENFDVYEWWVLEETGELITKFEWPREEPIEVVKNGFMYTRETEEETGLQQVVSYRIEIEEE